jgi:branched-chain amino acid transport system permease protein
LGPWEPLIAGLGLILTAVLNPEGIAGAMRDTTAAVKRRMANHGITPRPKPSTPVDQPAPSMVVPVRRSVGT